MQRVTVRNRVQSDFAMVPNALWSRQDLSFKAKGVAAYLCSLRDGQAMPYVAEIEATLGIGRDARKAAFAELEAVGFLSWRIERVRGRIVAKSLEVDPLVLAGVYRATEKPSDGSTVGRQSVASGVETRRTSDGKPGDLKKDQTKHGARDAKPATKPRRSLPECSGGASTLEDEGGERLEVAELSAFERTQLRRGDAIIWKRSDGELLRLAPASAAYRTLQAQLEAVERGA